MNKQLKIEIKLSKKIDWKVVQKLNYQVYENDKDHDDDLDMNHPFSPKGIKYYKDLASGKYGKCFVAYIDNKPVGYVALSIKDFGYRKSKYVEIENIGVDPKYRSRGIGKMLLDKTAKWAKEQKATRLFVSAYWKNKRARSFYRKNDFDEIGIELEKKL